MNFRIKNRGVKREERIVFFYKLNAKDECFLHSYIYNQNKNIYKFIKKLNQKNTYHFFIKKHFYMLD